MTNKKKRFKKLFENPKDTAFSKVKTVLNDLGYKITRIKGSHVQFEKSSDEHLTISVHNNKVTKRYIKYIIKELQKYEKMQVSLFSQRYQ